ncbi:conserved hypothetical protein [Neospora caninum Liverpool]|uniref:Uncharacterized protein n=1 Tax=Neospora caninum (strain Liverpool) TaxID=572307 RepID=F0VML6_NEOCL|nr:conserved hypothetical protein [Neospora caninum Liverpool]CBZ54962.1 conserved hypothetical protein [Neospora caninum Liverpool]CEL69684.1 TPA: hypothetical protein BN1204_053890 [Neospora caninum Liverpool]|eukprot:XP_003884990.1 conserved hypothetical protein [Neospora caninum Liverpool]
MEVGILRYVGRLTVLLGLVACLIGTVPQRGSCDVFGASLRGRNALASLFWRVRNAPFAESVVAKYSVFTSDDTEALTSLVEKVNMLGIGIQFFCEYISSLNKSQRAYVWGVAESTDAAQSFVNKYYKAQDLVGKGMASGDILYRIQYVLNGYTALPVLEGYSRFMADQFSNFRKGFLIFCSDVSDALLKHETRRLYRIFRDGLPLLTTCLKTLLTLSTRTTDREVREARVIVARGIDKLFQLDSTLLALSPNAPRELTEARRTLMAHGLRYATDARQGSGTVSGVPSSGRVNDSEGTADAVVGDMAS